MSNRARHPERGRRARTNKAKTEYFSKKEQSLVSGIFNSGSNLGAILAPLTVLSYSLGSDKNVDLRTNQLLSHNSIKCIFKKETNNLHP